MKIILNLYVIILLSLINNCPIINAQSNFAKPTILNNNCNYCYRYFFSFKYYDSLDFKSDEIMGISYVTDLYLEQYKNKSIGYIFNDLKKQYELIHIKVSNNGEKFKPSFYFRRNNISMSFKINDSTMLDIYAITHPNEEFYEENDSLAINKMLYVENFVMYFQSINIYKNYYRSLKHPYMGFIFKKDRMFNSYKFFPIVRDSIENKYFNECGRTFVNYSDANKLKTEKVGDVIKEVKKKYLLLARTLVQDSSFLESLVWLKKYKVIYTFLKDDSTLFEVGIRLKDALYNSNLTLKKIESLKDFESDFILIDINKYCKQIIEDTKYIFGDNEINYSHIKSHLGHSEDNRIFQAILDYFPDIAKKYNLIFKDEN